MTRLLTVGSTFTGVGGADLGFEWAGFKIRWQCEFDSWKQQILRAHWPDVELYDDIRTMQDPPPVDVMIGGFPCQDLSVAGRRKGFDGERSVLAFEFLRVAESIQPRWIILENVPGLLSSNRGRDFARLVDEVVGCGYGVAWRILDARYFGVPQRRRRVFIVARRADSEHDPRSASRLALRALFESGGGDTSSGWQAWQETARTARRGVESCGVGGVMGDVSHTLTSEGHDASEDGSGRGTPIVGSHGDPHAGPTGTLTRMYSEQSGQDFGGGQESSRVVCEPDPAGALTKRYAKGVNTTMDDGAIIAHTSACDRVNGGGQSESSAFRKSRRAASVTDDETWVDADHANTLNAFDQGDVRTTHAVVEQASTLQAGGGERGNRLDAEMAAGGQLVAQTIMGDVTHALTRAASKATTEDGTGRGAPIVAETFSVYPEGGNDADIAASPAERSPSLTKVKSERGIHVASGFSAGQSANARSIGYEEGLSPTLRTGGGNSIPTMHQHMTVRRLTPVECERLMGWPDGFTAPPGVKAPDSKRYAACGDGIVAPVAFWIADRIRMIEEEGGI